MRVESTPVDNVANGPFTVSLSSTPDGAPRELVGGKAASLTRLISSGYPVPMGFAVTTRAYREFLTENDVVAIIDGELENLKSSDYTQLSFAAKRIRDAIMAGAFSTSLKLAVEEAVDTLCHDQPQDVLAVRSSAIVEDSGTTSWAGLFDSFLDVPPGEVCEYIQRCWASAFGSRALSYGRDLEIDYKTTSFAVVVQLMVHGDVSGVAFSVDPGSSESNRMLIEASPGSGEAVVAGRDRPYAVVVDKNEGIVLRRSFGSHVNAELLSASNIRELARTISSIEQVFGVPVDVEWAITGKTLAVLQARPITGTFSARSVSDSKQAGLPDVLDYELTFKVIGLGFLFADLLARGFGYLHPLFTYRHGEFRQYFTNERMEYAAREGYRWLSQEGGFARYRAEFEDLHANAQTAFDRILSSDLTAESSSEFFELLAQYFIYYSKTDFEFTNLTFLYAEEDTVVRDNLRELAEFKDVARVWINRVSIDDDCTLNEFLNKVSSQTSLPRNDLDVYKITEIGELLTVGNKLTDSALTERSDAYAVYVVDSRIWYVTGRTALDYTERIGAIEELRSHSEIVGQVANGASQDRVEGVVRVINVDYSDLDRMDQRIAEMIEGEILVSEFTAPELMAACRKAKAIVTDLGGMLSHAAIVSRELGIPCVVGTQHASLALSSGDRIAINLDSGIVEKLG